MASATVEDVRHAGKSPRLAPRRRKQWGRDRRSRAMPMVPKPVSDTRVAMARLAIIVTVTAWVGYLVSWFFEDFFKPGYETAIARTEAVLYLLIVTMLTVSALAYLLSRLGFFYRTRTHHRASRAVIDQFFEKTTREPRRTPPRATPTVRHGSRSTRSPASRTPPPTPASEIMGQRR
jgi:hypothetical protein